MLSVVPMVWLRHKCSYRHEGRPSPWIQLTPHLATNQMTPHLATNKMTPHLATNQMTPHLATNQMAPNLATNQMSLHLATIPHAVLSVRRAPQN